MNPGLKGKKIALWASVTLVLLIVWFNLPSSSITRSEGHNVRYEVTGIDGYAVRSVSLAYTNASGGSEQRNEQVPWTLEMTKPVGSFLYLSAQNEDEYSEGVRAAIYVDGTLLQEARATAEYGIATVSGRVQ
jgi:hypothetical protein